jgi:nitric oxide reductase activation protein
MNKYVVKVSSIFSNIIEVEADNEENAKVKAQDFLENREDPENKDKPIRHYYESTFPPEHWQVITQEKFEELKKQVETMVESEAAGQENADENEPNNIVEPSIIVP